MFPDDDGNGVDERKGIGGGDRPFDPMDYLEVEVEAGDEVGDDSQEEEDTDKPLYTCRVCGKAFKGRRCLLKHEAQHWGDMGNNYDQEDLAEDDSNSGQANDRPSYQVRQDPISIIFYFISLAHSLSKALLLLYRGPISNQRCILQRRSISF